MNLTKLKQQAIKAVDFAYAPYSNFRVGAAILGKNGKIYIGCNVENRSYSLTICAERTAITNAILDNCRDFEAIAIFSPDSAEPLPPCGACRQVISEFCKKEMPVIFAGKDKEFVLSTVKEIYPFDSLHELKK
jgi:cytidine deaminase